MPYVRYIFISEYPEKDVDRITDPMDELMKLINNYNEELSALREKYREPLERLLSAIDDISDADECEDICCRMPKRAVVRRHRKTKADQSL